MGVAQTTTRLILHLVDDKPQHSHKKKSLSRDGIKRYLITIFFLNSESSRRNILVHSILSFNASFKLRQYFSFFFQQQREIIFSE